MRTLETSRLILGELGAEDAFLPTARGQGYASEAALAVIKMARKDFGLSRVAAIIHPDNKPSRALAESIGMHFDSMVRLAPEDEEICMYIVSA
jgi:RimJ/RimL family protein N-acetyltransferase